MFRGPDRWSLSHGKSRVTVPFDPATLSPTLWYKLSDSATILEAAADAAEVGDAISEIGDKSGNADHLTQATSGKRAVYSQSGSILYAAFDGVDDGYSASSVALGSNVDVFMTANHTSDTAFIDLFSVGGGSKFLGCGETHASASYGGAGSPTILVNGSSIGTSRTNYRTAVDGLGWQVIAWYGADLSTWGTFQIGDYDTTYDLIGGVAEIFVVPALTAGQRTQMTTYMGAGVGLTL